MQAYGSTGTCLCKHTVVLERVCASFVVYGSTGTCFCKLCSTKHVPVLPYTTSSTAQGGGGSFKNRKPIGEICCCESGMAERIH